MIRHTVRFAPPNRWGLGFPLNFSSQVVTMCSAVRPYIDHGINSEQLTTSIYTQMQRAYLTNHINSQSFGPRILLSASSYTVATKKSTSSTGSLATNSDLKTPPKQCDTSSTNIPVQNWKVKHPPKKQKTNFISSKTSKMAGNPLKQPSFSIRICIGYIFLYWALLKHWIMKVKKDPFKKSHLPWSSLVASFM